MSPDLHHLSGAYAVDALDTAERRAFEQHLAGCADCRAEVAELTGAAHALSAVTPVAPPPALREEVLGAIRRVRPMPPVPEPEERTPAERTPGAVLPFLRRTSTWLVAAAVVLALAVGGMLWSPWTHSDPTLTAIDRVRQAQDATTVTSTKGEITATLAYSRALGRSVLTVSGMPPAPEGRTYQLWYMGKDQVPHPAGFMTAGDDGRGTALLRGDVNDAAAVGVTVEPAGGSPAPTSAPILVMALT